MAYASGLTDVRIRGREGRNSVVAADPLTPRRSADHTERLGRDRL